MNLETAISRRQLALITGATSGIGEGLAQLIESKGIATLVTGRQVEKLASFKGKKIVCDLAGDREALKDFIRSEAPDLLVNNAGFGLYGKAIDQSIEEQLNMVEVNNKALLELTLEGAKALKAHGKRGVIMNISSAASFQPFPTSAVYAASKAFVTSLSQSLDEELMPDGIRVLTACPGKVATNFSKRASKGQGKKVRQSMALDYAVEQIWRQIESGQRVNIFDWKYHLMVRLGQFLIPNALITHLAQKMQTKGLIH